MGGIGRQCGHCGGILHSNRASYHLRGCGTAGRYDTHVGLSQEMPSSPDTLAEAKVNFRKIHEAYKRRDDGANLHKHPVPKWTPRLGSRVLMEGQTTPGVKDIPAVVLLISPSDQTCTARFR